ncbi:DNA polymerase I [Candidatus Falkowbacteria bacterium]|nr:DNA polymerase I [Candidatus Falkowbacteria bacterium]
MEIFQKLNFKKLLGQLSTLENKLIAKGNQAGRRQGSLFEGGPKPEQTLAEKNPHHQYNLIDGEKELKKFLSQLKQQKEFCFDTETSNLDPFVSDLIGISFSWEKNIAYYLPIKTIKQIKNELKKIFADKKIQKIGHNLKFDIAVLARAGLKVNAVYFDTMVASYLLNPSSHQHGLDTLAFIELGHQMQLIEELIGKGKNQISLAEAPVEKVACYSCEDAIITWLLYQKFAKELDKQGMFGLFEKIDMPLVEVLAGVEKNGVKIDDKFLQKLSQKFAKKIKALEEETGKIAGEKFNLASPLQLKKILFEKMKIDPAGLGKTKTGISTGATELQKLAVWLRENKEDGKKRKIIDLLLAFRELSKLKNTYLDALPELINPKDGRVHTSYNQTVTATGRLSSSDPNLQNIPIRTELGRQIRKAFIAEAGYKILKADYSQIELRIVASLANDKKMLEAFENKVDIHTQTAAAINEVDIKEVTSEMRRAAKEVNFGVLYGMGAWGLAQRTGVSSQKAQEFINHYFEAFKGVKKYINETIEIAREKCYVETFYGRRRYIPEINSGVQQVRSAAERMAINTPVQGSASDLIKLAMIEIHKELPKISPKTKMILQVHDELVFEVPEKDIKKVAEFVQEAMCRVYKLRAPIEAEVSAGDNWGETEKIKL